MILDPVPAYVVKTVDVTSGEKVFINVCTDPQINPPNTLDASEIAVQVTRGQDWIVPIVVSTGRNDKDKAGQPCFIADCCMHPSVVLLGIEDPSVKVLTVETCIELVEDRFNRVLNRDYKFPRMKAKGTLEKTEVDLQMPHPQPDHHMDIDEPEQSLNLEQQGKQELPSASVKVVDSHTDESPFYFHVYRGKYSGSGNRPSHVIEVDGEQHDIQIVDQNVSLKTQTLQLPFLPQKRDAFYNSDDNTTYIMLWKQV